MTLYRLWGHGLIGFWSSSLTSSLRLDQVCVGLGLESKSGVELDPETTKLDETLVQNHTQLAYKKLTTTPDPYKYDSGIPNPKSESVPGSRFNSAGRSRHSREIFLAHSRPTFPRLCSLLAHSALPRENSQSERQFNSLPN